jgi:hypothetical protein
MSRHWGGKNRALCSGQLGEQRLGLFQSRRVESFREPTVDWREQLTHRHAPLVRQQTAEVQRCAHLPKLWVLSLCDIDRLTKARFGRGAITSVMQQRAAQSVDLDVKLPLWDRFHDLLGFGQSLPRRSQPVRFAERVCKQRETIWPKYFGAGGSAVIHSRRERLDALLFF